jgi:hypothetical protein
MNGECSYVDGDTIEDGARKAEHEGYKPGSQAHASFISAFAKMINDDAQRRPQREAAA